MKHDSGDSVIKLTSGHFNVKYSRKPEKTSADLQRWPADGNIYTFSTFSDQPVPSLPLS